MWTSGVRFEVPTFDTCLYFFAAAGAQRALLQRKLVIENRTFNWRRVNIWGAALVACRSMYSLLSMSEWERPWRTISRASWPRAMFRTRLNPPQDLRKSARRADSLHRKKRAGNVTVN